jgi:hypothetical protein
VILSVTPSSEPFRFYPASYAVGLQLESAEHRLDAFKQSSYIGLEAASAYSQFAARGFLTLTFTCK